MSVIDVAWSTPDEEVFGIVGAQGTALAYPERIIARHELANDMLDATAVAVSFCTLCRAARLFDRPVAGRTPGASSKMPSTWEVRLLATYSDPFTDSSGLSARF